MIAWVRDWVLWPGWIGLGFYHFTGLVHMDFARLATPTL